MKPYLFVAALICACALRTDAGLTDKKRKIQEEFEHVPVPELGVRAAQLIRSTPAAERGETAVLAVQTILGRYPGAAVTVVSAISKAAPETAPAVVAAAKQIAPASAEYVEVAARNATPTYREASSAVQAASIPSRAPEVSGASSGNGGGDQMEHDNNRSDNPRRGGTVRNEPTLPNGKPRPQIRPHPEHPEHPPHPPHPVHYNKPHDHDDDHDGDGQGQGHGRNENGHGQQGED